MPRKPIASPGNSVRAGVEVSNQIERVVTVRPRPAREIVELPGRVDAEGTAGGAEAIIAGAIGDGDPPGVSSDLNHVAVEPGAIGGGMGSR